MSLIEAASTQNRKLLSLLFGSFFLLTIQFSLFTAKNAWKAFLTLLRGMHWFWTNINQAKTKIVFISISGQPYGELNIFLQSKNLDVVDFLYTLAVHSLATIALTLK